MMLRTWEDVRNYIKEKEPGNFGKYVWVQFGEMLHRYHELLPQPHEEGINPNILR